MASWSSGMHGKGAESTLPPLLTGLLFLGWAIRPETSRARCSSQPGSQGQPRAMTISLGQSVAFFSLPMDVQHVVLLGILFRYNSLLQSLATLSLLHCCSGGTNLAVWFCWLQWELCSNIWAQMTLPTCSHGWHSLIGLCPQKHSNPSYCDPPISQDSIIFVCIVCPLSPLPLLRE